MAKDGRISKDTKASVAKDDFDLDNSIIIRHFIIFYMHYTLECWNEGQC